MSEIVPHTSGSMQTYTPVEAWLSRFRSPHTQAAYGRDLRLWMEAGSPVTASGLWEWVAGLQGSENTRARRLQSVRSFLRWCHRLGILERNEMEIVTSAPAAPRAKRKIASRFLDRATTFRLLSRLDQPWGWVAYATGARVSELSNLKCSDVSDHTDRIVIRFDGKGGVERSVALDGLEADRVRNLLAWSGPEDPLFGGISIRTMQRQVSKAGKLEGLTRISPHWLRHAHITHALDRSAPMALVQQTVGHRSLAATQYYAHAHPSESSSKFVTF